MPSKLEYQDENGQLQVFQLSEPDILIGRLSDCEIRTQDDTVTRRHARVACREGKYRVEDLGSDNGTRVNGQLVRVHVLQSNDSIECSQRIYILEEVTKVFAAAADDDARVVE